MSTDPGSEQRGFLRHSIATLAYRGGKVLRGAPDGFGAFRIGESTRSPAAILAHIGDLLDWGLTLAQGKQVWHESSPSTWEAEVARFFEGLSRLDTYLASEDPLGVPAENVFQGPIADALTHIGQLALLRRLGGSPVRGENYFKADIIVGRVGPEQSAPRREFD